MNRIRDQLQEGKRPMMLLIDLLGRKWSMRIIWELKQETCTFRELQIRCGGISPTIVNRRVKDLLEANIITKSEPKGYKLSQIGYELVDLFDPINQWSQRWEETFDPPQRLCT